MASSRFPGPLRAALVATVLGWGLAGSATAAVGAADFATVEYEVLGKGASAGWRGALAGGAPDRQRDGGGRVVPDEFGTARRATEADRAHEPGGPSNLGRKLKAGALSAVLPGAGQYYNGDRRRAFVMAGVEAGIWTAYFVFDAQGADRMESARQWAGIYAGTGGEHAESYWQAVGQFMDSDAYNDSRYREARALQEPVSGLVGADDAWQWVNQDRRYGYTLLRAKGNSAYDRRDFMILFAVLNRAVSVFDAVTGVRGDGELARARVLGLDVALELAPALVDPGARCVVSRGF
ncbi:hypothetical protein FJ250_09390 [bacterium]|nr:hypothetical protein [bacterium]